MRNITIIFLLYGLFATVSTACAQDVERSYWWACPADLNQPVRPEYTAPDIEIGATEVRADNTRIVKDGITFFSGNVEIVRGQRSVRGNEVSYDDNARFFDIAGDAHIWDPALIWRGEHATFDMNSDIIQLQDCFFWLA